MATLSRHVKATFVLIGSKGEAESVQLALATYRSVGGMAEIHDAVGKTDMPELAALLAQCRLLLTRSSTGPMHIAIRCGDPVIDLSVGHVDFDRTGHTGRDIGSCSRTSDVHHVDSIKCVPIMRARIVSFPIKWRRSAAMRSGLDHFPNS